MSEGGEEKIEEIKEKLHLVEIVCDKLGGTKPELWVISMELLKRIEELEYKLKTDVQNERIEKAEAELKRLRKAVEKYLAGWDKDGPNYNTEILENVLSEIK